MAEEQEAPPEEEKKKGGSGMMRTLMLVLAVVMVAAIGGLLVYKFVILPKFSEEDKPDQTVELPPANLISPTAVTVSFDQGLATVRMPAGSAVPASLLSYAVTLECNNQPTADLVGKQMSRFTDMINKQHDSKTRAELDDPMIKTSIQKQIMLEANTILKQLQPESIDPEIRITAVFHTAFFVNDQL
jgi:flagellar basal body-associated protein FliL